MKHATAFVCLLMFALAASMPLVAAEKEAGFKPIFDTSEFFLQSQNLPLIKLNTNS